MADGGRRGRDSAIGLVGAVAFGAVTASLGAMPARADEPAYPSWQDVQHAKQDESATAAEATRITGLITGLQDTADAAGRTAQIAAERFHLAKAQEDAARTRHQALAAQADVAQSAARTSRMRAGLLAAHLARIGGGDMSADLLLNADTANGLLYRLATMSQLSAQSQSIYAQALADERQAEALGAQADVAADELAQRAATAQAALDEAQRASAAATAAVTAEQQHATRLLAQLADLRQTTTRVAARYVAGVQAQRDAAAAAASQRAAAASPPGSGSPEEGAAPGSSADPSGSTPAGSESAGSKSAGTESAGSESAGTESGGSGSEDAAPASAAPASSSPDESSPAPSPSPAPAPAPAAPPPAPNSAQAASAVAFARDQIGDPYRFAGAGPDAWDCSGLTMQAYASVGIGIGGHSATAQYRLAAAQHQLVPYADVQVGDLVFYTDGSGDMYHVGIYSGSGMMIEAPYDGVPVREVAVRAYQRVAEVARPTA